VYAVQKNKIKPMPSDEQQRPKSIYDIFSENLAACEFTGETDLYPNVNKTFFTPFAPRFFARKKYVANVDGESVAAWVYQSGRNIQIWSV
jgi:hypothetical protein